MDARMTQKKQSSTLTQRRHGHGDPQCAPLITHEEDKRRQDARVADRPPPLWSDR